MTRRLHCNHLLVVVATVLVLASNVSLYAQLKPCGIDHYQEELYSRKPELREQAKDAMLNNLKQAAKHGFIAHSKETEYIVPVVFHVIYEPGREFANISDEQIYESIEITNQNFAGENPWVDQVIPEFEDIIGMFSNLKFKIASKDPAGNCTTGIIRYEQELPDGGTDQEYKSGRQWPSDQYLNIYIVPKIASGAAGYSGYPVNGNEDSDGVVLLYNYLGSTGASNPVRSFTLAHEIGHYMGLPHVWGGTNNPNLPSNCGMDDGIADTPQTIGSPNCSNVYRETCNSLDNVQNFMDYSYCSYMFTEGQMAVVLQSLRSSIAGRSNLWSQQNLENTGVLYDGEAPDYFCVADFKSSLENNLGCLGNPVNFEDKSLYNIVSREWSFPGGTPASSTAPNPSVVYNEAGVFSVTLTVTTSTGDEETVTKQGAVTIPEQSFYLEHPVEENFDNPAMFDDPPFGWFMIYNPDNDVFWEITEGAGVTDNRSAVLNSYFVERIGHQDGLLTTQFELPDEASLLSFYYAHANRFGSDSDYLEVQISNDCGKSWTRLSLIENDQLVTTDNPVQEEMFIPDEEEWEKHTISLDQYAGQFIQVRFLFTHTGGNNIYIDRMEVQNTTSIQSKRFEGRDVLNLSPNPVKVGGVLQVKTAVTAPVNIKITDRLGRTIATKQSAQPVSGRIELKIPKCKTGVYFITLSSANNTNTLPLMIID